MGVSEDAKPLYEVVIDAWQARHCLSHPFPTSAGWGRCLMTWQRAADGRLYAECPHARYVVSEET